MPKIVWLGDKTGLNLKPFWDVKTVRVHTVMMEQPDHTRKDTCVLVLLMTAEQCRKVREDFGDVPINMLGCVVIPLFPNAILWTWKAPKGYPSVKDGTYTAFEIVEVEDVISSRQ